MFHSYQYYTYHGRKGGGKRNIFGRKFGSGGKFFRDENNLNISIKSLKRVKVISENLYPRKCEKKLYLHMNNLLKCLQKK